jgi:hypothetical protein
MADCVSVRAVSPEGLAVAEELVFPDLPGYRYHTAPGVEPWEAITTDSLADGNTVPLSPAALTVTREPTSDSPSKVRIQASIDPGTGTPPVPTAATEVLGPPPTPSQLLILYREAGGDWEKLTLQQSPTYDAARNVSFGKDATFAAYHVHYPYNVNISEPVIVHRNDSRVTFKDVAVRYDVYAGHPQQPAPEPTINLQISDASFSGPVDWVDWRVLELGPPTIWRGEWVRQAPTTSEPVRWVEAGNAFSFEYSIVAPDLPAPPDWSYWRGFLVEAAADRMIKNDTYVTPAPGSYFLRGSAIVPLATIAPASQVVFDDLAKGYPTVSIRTGTSADLQFNLAPIFGPVFEPQWVVESSTVTATPQTLSNASTVKITAPSIAGNEAQGILQVNLGSTNQTNVDIHRVKPFRVLLVGSVLVDAKGRKVRTWTGAEIQQTWTPGIEAGIQDFLNECYGNGGPNVQFTITRHPDVIPIAFSTSWGAVDQDFDTGWPLECRKALEKAGIYTYDFHVIAVWKMHGARGVAESFGGRIALVSPNQTDNMPRTVSHEIGHLFGNRHPGQAAASLTLPVSPGKMLQGYSGGARFLHHEWNQIRTREPR